MKKKLLLGLLGAIVLGLISAGTARAGTEEVQDYGGRQIAPPARRYYAPPPRPAYYLPPPPVGVAIYPRWRYYHRPFRFYGFHRRLFCHHRRWH